MRITIIINNLSFVIQAHGFTIFTLKYMWATYISWTMYDALRQQMTDLLWEHAL